MVRLYMGWGVLKLKHIMILYLMVGLLTEMFNLKFFVKNRKIEWFLKKKLQI